MMTKKTSFDTDWEIDQIELAIQYHQAAMTESLELDDKLSHFDKYSELKNTLHQLKVKLKNERSKQSA